MKTLLVVFMFTLSPEGNPEHVEAFTQTFDTIEECNYAGRNLREIIGADSPKYDMIKSLSYCVSERDYQKDTV